MKRSLFVCFIMFISVCLFASGQQEVQAVNPEDYASTALDGYPIEGLGWNVTSDVKAEGEYTIACVVKNNTNPWMAGFSGGFHDGVSDADFYGGSHAGVPAAGSSEGFHDGVPAAGSGIGDSGNSSDFAVPSGSGDILLSGKDDYAGMTGQYDSAGNGVWRGVENVLARVDVSRQKVIFVVNKMDRVTGMNAPAPLAIRAGLDRLKASYHLQESPEVYVSAKKGEGLDDLRMALTEVCAEYAISSDDVVVTNARHIDALKNARTSLTRVQDGLRSGLPTDLVSQDIREAIYHIGSIVGEISTDEVLGNIFKNFCIGK